MEGGNVMPLLEIHDIPGDLYEMLSMSAEMERRSVAQQTIALLRAALNTSEERMFRRRAIFQAIDALNLGDSGRLTDPADLIREDRDR
jgi:plasmid stability protein